MKIVIHGTKGGHDTFTPERIKMIDSRPDTNKVAAIGQEAYSINFAEQSVIFSKYKIIRDVIGDKRTGNISFAVIIEQNEKLDGLKIKELLDKLSDEFCSRHIINNNLNDFREDWSFVKNLQNQYESQIKKISTYNIDKIDRKVNDAAFIYFDSNEDLVKYFDAPYQDEYYAYKQVFFVEKRLEGTDENPLNALRYNENASLTIDLENPDYTLEFNLFGKGGVKIEVKVNDRIRNNKDKVKKKDTIHITWTKEYHETKKIIGNINKIAEDLDVNIINSTIGIKSADLKPITYTFLVQAVDSNFNNVENAKIYLRNSRRSDEKIIDKNTFALTEEELRNNKWIIFAKTENKTSEEKEIRVKDADSKISLPLKERKIIKFTIVDKTDGPISNCIIKFGRNNIYSDINGVAVLKFEGKEEIEKLWEIEISHKDFIKKTVPLDPAKSFPQFVNLQKKTPAVIEETVLIKGGKKKPKLWRKVIIVLLFLAVIVTSLLTFTDIFSNNKWEPISTYDIENRIDSYCEDVELNEITLNKLKKELDSIGNINEQNKPETSFWESIWSSNENDDEAFNNLNYNNYKAKIDSAISLREDANTGQISKLKLKSYSAKQKSFQDAIISIDSSKINFFHLKLYNDTISKMNLNQITELINSLKEKNNTNKETSTNTNVNKVSTEKKEGEIVKVNDGTQKKEKEKDFVTNTFETEFWTLVNSGNENLTKYQDLYNKNKKLNSPLFNYLKKIQNNAESFKEFKNIETVTRRKAKSLYELK